MPATIEKLAAIANTTQRSAARVNLDIPKSIGASVRDYGAVGDDVADDTAAFAACMTANAGRIVFIPEGTYLITGTVNVLAGTHVHGARGSILHKTSPSYQPLFSADQADGVSFEGFSINNTVVESVTYNGNGSTTQFAFSWPVNKAYDVYGYRTDADGVKYYSHPGSATFAVSLTGDAPSAGTVTTGVTDKPASGETYTLETPVPRLPVILLTDCDDAEVRGVRITRGSIWSIASTQDVANLTVADCRINEGQIRVSSVGYCDLDYFSSGSYAPPDPTYSHLNFNVHANQVIGPHGPEWFGNGISNAIGGTAEARYIKFNERIHGIQLEGPATTNGVASDNVVVGSHGDGIRLFSAGSLTVSGNRVTDSALSGIGPENGMAAVRSKEILVTNNYIARNTFDGIDLNYGQTLPTPDLTARKMRDISNWRESANWVVSGNIVEWNGVDGLESTGDSLSQSGGMGLFLWRAADVAVSGNTFRHNNLNGIGANGSRNLSITGNLFRSNGRITSSPRAGYQSGVYLYGTEQSAIVGNTFSNTGNSGEMTQRYGIYEDYLFEVDSSATPTRSYTMFSTGNTAVGNRFPKAQVNYYPSPADQRTFAIPWGATSGGTADIRVRHQCNTGTPWAASTVFPAGSVVYVAGSTRVYATTAGGTSGSTTPTHTSGSASDGGVTWAYINNIGNVIDLSTPSSWSLSGDNVVLTADSPVGYALQIESYVQTECSSPNSRVLQLSAPYSPLPWISLIQASIPPVDAFSHGLQIFNRTLGQPVWYTGSAWIDANGVTVGTVADRYEFRGTGSPEGVVTATTGATYRRTDGGAGTSLYVKESASGNTGWVAK